jgi:hypothetical protein
MLVPYPSECKVLRKTLGTTSKKVRGNQRKLREVKIHDLCSLSETVWVIRTRRIRLARYVARIREMVGVCKVFVRKPQRKRPLGIPIRIWEDNIKVNLM